MSYLPTWIVVAVGLLLLGLIVVRAARGVKRFNGTAVVVGARFADATGMLRARTAALRVAVRQRLRQTRTRVKHAPADVPSIRRGRQEEDRG